MWNFWSKVVLRNSWWIHNWFYFTWALLLYLYLFVTNYCALSSLVSYAFVFYVHSVIFKLCTTNFALTCKCVTGHPQWQCYGLCNFYFSVIYSFICSCKNALNQLFINKYSWSFLTSEHLAPVFLWQGAAGCYKAGCGKDLPWSRLLQEGDDSRCNGQHLILLCSWESCNVLPTGQSSI